MRRYASIAEFVLGARVGIGDGVRAADCEEQRREHDDWTRLSAIRVTFRATNVRSEPVGSRIVRVNVGHLSSATRDNRAKVERHADTSGFGRLLAAPGSQLLLSVGFVLLAAFLVGAFAQRVLLGEYALSVGPIEIPALAPISAAEATSAVAKITQSPTLQVAFRRVPGQVSAARHPQFESIEDPRLKFLSIRTELEDRLRDLAQAVGIDRDVRLNRLVDRLRLEQLFDDGAAAGLKQLLEIGGRVAQGAEVADDVVTSIEGEAARLLYALAELADRRRS